MKLFFLLNILILFILFLSSMLFYIKNPNNRVIKFIILLAFFFFSGLILMILRNEINDFLSIVIANTLFALGTICLHIIVKEILSLNSSWQNRYWIPITLIFINFYFFTYLDYNYIRAKVFFLFCMIYSIYFVYLFWKFKTKEFYIFEIFSLITFSIGSIIFSILFLHNPKNYSLYYFSNTDILFILPNIYMILVTLWSFSVLQKVRN